MHEKRDDAGMYRPLSDAEVRHERAKRETQTHEGRFTHSRDVAERRMPLDLDTKGPMFKNRLLNRSPYMPKVTK